MSQQHQRDSEEEPSSQQQQHSSSRGSRRESGSRRRSHSRDRDSRRRRDRGDHRSSHDDRRTRHRSRSRDRGDSSRRSFRRGSSRDREADPSVTPLHLRQSRTQAWDKAPPGCEGMSVAQVKNSGLFPTPGQPAKNTYMAVTGGIAQYGYNPEILGTVSALGPTAIKANRRLFVGNLPDGMKERDLVDFLNETMRKNKLYKDSGDPVVSADMRLGRTLFGLVSFRSGEEAEAAMAMDGLECDGRPMEIRRPTDQDEADFYPGGISKSVADGPNKIFVGSIPNYLTDEQVMELLKAFGELKGFCIVRDYHTQVSKGFGFCEYMDPAVTDIAIQALNGMEIGDKRLVLHRSAKGERMMKNGGGSGELPMLPMDILNYMSKNIAPPTRVLMLLNMVGEDDLEKDIDYEEFYNDIKTEIERFAPFEELMIPRPDGDKQIPGLGKTMA